jgi:hypothetical protein
MRRRWWLVSLSAWGCKAAWGTEAEAEEWRVHKARWEREVAVKVPTKLRRKVKDESEAVALARVLSSLPWANRVRIARSGKPFC